ncbi:MAG: hypothetical protein QF577_05625 [Phycisphaerae bacterium]|nr:hypothetical protein [Phycisphaerae bacterium]
MAVMSLTAGNVEVQVREDLNWAISDIYRNGSVIVGSPHVNVAQAGTLKINGGFFVGGGHASETTLGFSLSVDGVSQTAQNGLAYAGSEIGFSRTTNIAGIYELHSSLTVTPDGLVEDIVMTNLSTATVIETFYAILSAPPKRFFDYVAFNRQGGVVASGQTLNYDMSIHSLDSTMSVAQYDASLNEGVSVSITENQNYGWGTFLIDRPYDNKSYFRLREFEGQPEEGDVCEFQLHTVFFDATEETWQDTAQSLFVSLPGLLGDANGDERVDSTDLAIWQQNYDPLGENQNTFNMGDWDRDWLVDSTDLALWQQNYDPINGDGLVAAHTPEPATFFVMMAAGLPLLLKRRRKRPVR